MAVRKDAFFPIQGMDKVLQNLRRVSSKVQGASLAGLVQAGFLVLRESNKICPVDLGNLRASGYVMWTKKQFDMDATDRAFIMTKKGIRSKFKIGPAKAQLESDYDAVLEEARGNVESLTAHGDIAVEVGYSAYYAIYVHEDLEASHPSKRTIGGMSTKAFQKRLRVNEEGALTFEGGPGEAQFLKKALEQNMMKIVSILVKRARIK